MLDPVSQRRPRSSPRPAAFKLPNAVRGALGQLRSGVPRDTVAAELIRSYSELDLFRVRLGAGDRRQGEIARLVVAVRRITID